MTIKLKSITINLKKMFTLLIAIFPIVSQYKSIIPGFSIGDTLLFIITFFIIINLSGKGNIYDTNKIIKSPFTWFILYIIFGSLISILFQYYSAFDDVIIRSVRYIFYIITATFISYTYFDFNYFVKIYRRIVIFATLFLFIQLFLFNFKGFILIGNIPGLAIGNIDYSEETMRNLYSYFYRPSSIFLEPGHFVRYTLPYLAYILFNKNIKGRINFIGAIMLTTGILFTTSGQGIIISFFIWLLWFISGIYNMRSRKINNKFILGLIIFIIVAFIVVKNPTIDRSLDRLFGSSTASSNSRILRGTDIYMELSFIHKIIGVGYGNIGAYLLYNTGGIQSEYMNSINYILVNLGIIGLGLLIWIFIYLWRNTKGFHRIFVYILILLSGVSTLFISSNILFYLPIILSGINKNKTKLKNSIT